MQTIYVDVLFIFNMFIDICILKLSARFRNLSVKTWRFILGGVVGGVGSFVIFLPTFSPFISILYQFILSACVILCCFGFRSPKSFLSQIVTFYLMSFAFAGIMLAIWYFVSPQGLLIKNNIVYFNVSPVEIIILAIICYALLWFIRRLGAKQKNIPDCCDIEVCFNSERRTIHAKIDSGCNIKEPFSGLPVIIAERNYLPPLPKNPPRPVPFKSVGGDGLLKSWKPNEFYIIINNEKIKKECYVAVTDISLTDNTTNALIPIELTE